MAKLRRTGAPEIRRAELPLLQANEASAFSGYVSLFSVVDSGGNMVMTGTFARSLIKRGARGVKMLWQHHAAEPIGLWTSIVENARGLKVEGRLDLSVARGARGAVVDAQRRERRPLHRLSNVARHDRKIERRAAAS